MWGSALCLLISCLLISRLLRSQHLLPSPPAPTPQVVPWLLARSTKRINALHLERVEAVLDSFEAQFRDDPDMADDGYFGAMEDASMPELIACMDSHERRDELARPLLRHAVRAGAACLSLADARKLALPEQPAWGTAGTWWAEEWAPERAAHAAFHPRFQAAASTLLLALHRGLPGVGAGQGAGGSSCSRVHTRSQLPAQSTCVPARLPVAGAAPDGGPINLPAPVAHAIVRCMALAPGMEAAWVPLAHVPDGVNLNRAG